MWTPPAASSSSEPPPAGRGLLETPSLELFRLLSPSSSTQTILPRLTSASLTLFLCVGFTWKRGGKCSWAKWEGENIPWVGQAGSWGPDGETTPNYASFSILPALDITGGIGDRELWQGHICPALLCA